MMLTITDRRRPGIFGSPDPHIHTLLGLVARSWPERWRGNYEYPLTVIDEIGDWTPEVGDRVRVNAEGWPLRGCAPAHTTGTIFSVGYSGITVRDETGEEWYYMPRHLSPLPDDCTLPAKWRDMLERSDPPYMWAAMDEKGWVYFYSRKPTLSSEQWRSSVATAFATCVGCEDDITFDWKKSLYQRKENQSD